MQPVAQSVKKLAAASFQPPLDGHFQVTPWVLLMGGLTIAEL